LNPHIPLPQDRPTCEHAGCTAPKAISSTRKDGRPTYRKVCHHHHAKAICDNHGVGTMADITAKRRGYADTKAYRDAQDEERAKKAGFPNAKAHKDFLSEELAKKAGFASAADYKRAQLKEVAKAAGFDDVNDYINSKHPYLKHRKNYCENADGRLGHVCTTTIVWKGVLDVDHINGNPSDNDPANLQTLCKCCHAVKTRNEKDYLTPGRKALGIKY
jgi:hypothetical protein